MDMQRLSKIRKFLLLTMMTSLTHFLITVRVTGNKESHYVGLIASLAIRSNSYKSGNMSDLTCL